MTDGYGRRLVIDNSAWARILRGQLSPRGQQQWEAAVDADEVVVCDPFRLEALYSARTAKDYVQLVEELGAFRQARGDDQTWQLAMTAQARLASRRHVSHRVKIVDLLVAAAAMQAGAGVLHYDHDFDTIATYTDLSVESVWLAPRGSLP